MAASIILRTSNTWRASSTLGRATKAPRAGSSVTTWSRLSWLSAWRTRVRLTLKMSAMDCSASLVPGISRRSTMAAVMASTMRWVLPGAAPPAARTLRVRWRGTRAPASGFSRGGAERVVIGGGLWAGQASLGH
jgi:hypothetical protein